MKHNNLIRLSYGCALGTFISALGIAGLPAGLMHAIAEDNTEKGQSEQDLMLIAKKAAQLKKEGKYAEAASIWREILKHVEQALGTDHPLVARCLVNLAELHDRQGLHIEAESFLKLSLEIQEQAFGPESQETDLSLILLADHYKARGLHGEAIPPQKRSLEIRVKNLPPDHPEIARSLNDLAVLYNSQGVYYLADRLYRQSLAIYAKHPEKSELAKATTLANLAFNYSSKGLHSEAEQHYLRSLEIRKRALGLEHPATANILDNLAQNYGAQGYYGKAVTLFQQSLAIREKILGPDHLDTAKTLHNMAWLYQEQGLERKAIPINRRALKIFRRILGSYHPDTAASLNNLAGLYQSQGLYNEAIALNLQVLSINEKALGPNHPDTALSLNNLAGLFQSQGLYDEAIALNIRALGIRKKVFGPNHPDTAVSLHNLGKLHDLKGEHSKAGTLLNQSLAVYTTTFGPDHKNTITIRNALAYSYIAQGKHKRSIPILQQSVKSQSRIMQREAPILARSERQPFINSFGRVDDALYAYTSQGSAYNQLALLSRLNRHGLLQEIEKRQAQLAALPGDQQQIAHDLRALTQQLSSLSITPQQRQALKTRQQTLEKELYRLLPQLEPRIVEVEQVAASLPTDGVLIEFQRYQPFDGKKPAGERWGKARYLAMVLKPDRTITVVHLGEAAALEKAIALAVSTAREQQADASVQFEALSQLLLKPLAQATAGATTWFVSPDGELNRLPFAALTAPGGNGYLAEAVDLRLLTTGRELLDLQKPSPGPKQSTLVVADPAYDHNGRSKSSAVVASTQDTTSDARLRSSDLSGQLRWAPLPATAEEGAAIKAITGGELLVQQQATAEAVKRAPTPNVLHLATHAFYLPDQPGQASDRGTGPGAAIKTLRGESPMLRSGIALAGANQPNANPNDDGYLTALEVAQLSWEGTDLVVISACESGLGDLQVGEGVYGLKRAIAVAGARSSLLSLWKVDDEATRLFMENFYQRLKQGESKAAALAATQKQFRESPELKAYSHPFYWAAFQLSGDWGPVKGL